MVRIMLDTNAILDLVFNRYPDRHEAMVAAIANCKEGTHELLVCAHSLVDMTYTLENNAGMKAAIPDPATRGECARHARETVFRFCTVCAIDEKVCEEAHHDTEESDYEDALVRVCALANQATIVVSSDNRAFVSGGLIKLTPTEFARYVGT